MEKNQTYHDQVTIEQTQKLREVLKTLPAFTRDYFRAMEPTTSARTRISYAYDIRVFFHFLLSENPAFKDKTMADLTVDVLDQLQAVDIEEFQEYLKVRILQGKVYLMLKLAFAKTDILMLLF